VKEETANNQVRSRVILLGTVNLVLAVVGIIAAHLLNQLAAKAGYDVRPETATMRRLQAALLLVLIIAFSIFLVIVGARRSKNFRVLRIGAGLSAILICLYPFLFTSEFAEAPPGWNAFQKRMKKDIRPRDLEVWLRNAAATNSAADSWRRITPNEFANFGPPTVNYPPPRLNISKLPDYTYTAIEWGSDIQTWAITLGNRLGGQRWEGDLYFRYNSK
jgi:hypothetical protein